MKTIKIKQLENKITTITTKAKARIESPKQMEQAATLLSQINTYGDTIRAEKEKITKPMVASLAAARALFAPLELKIAKSVSSIRNAMSAYQTAQIALKRVEEAKIVNKIATEGLSLDKAAQALNKLDGPTAAIATPKGTVTFRTEKRLKIIDPKLIPLNFWVIDEIKLRKTLLVGEKVPGAELEEVQNVVNYRG